ncbi:MAG: alpha/beta fold hydrolase [Gemmataceae bacterium]
MTPLLLYLLFAPLTPPAPPVDEKATPVDTLFVKVGPNPKVPGRTPGQPRALVLIHGLSLHFLHGDKIQKAKLRPWQEAESPVVKRLGQEGDVYSLAYGQTVAVETVCEASLLLRHLAGLKAAGYTQIVLIGHSAGGLIARQVVEDFPDLGVTRVIQVCSPNAGSVLAALKTARGAQMAFLLSLTRGARLKVLEERAKKRLPVAVEFVCVVGATRVGGDGVVVPRSQWSSELQAQGVPAYPLRATHWEAMHSPKTGDLLARLAVEPQPRWPPDKIIQVRKQLLGS